MAEAHALDFDLTPEERSALAGLACASIEHGLATGTCPEDAAVPRPDQEHLLAPCGAFVTLTRHGRLRGCIGNIVGQAPLYLTVSRMGYAAAFQDPRFPPLRAEEWPDTAMEISVLSELSRCPDPALVEIGRHGLVLALGRRSGVFLPQVPVEQGWDREAYLENLCLKAGLSPGSWRDPAAELYWYEALVFHARP